VLSRRWLINYALILVIAALAFAGIHFDSASDEKPAPRISALQAQDIDRIELQADALQFTMQRDKQGWRITTPIDWPAQGDSVERLLSILNIEASALGKAAEVDLQALGLQPPAATLRLNDTPLLFGATNNIGGRRYVMLESRIYLLPDVHLAFAAQGLPGVVDRRLLPGRSDLTALRFPEFEIRRDSDGQWRSTRAPEPDAAALELLVGNWQALPASRIHRFDPDSGPGELIEARFADRPGIDFRLLSTQPEIVIANPGIGLQYHFRASSYAQLIAPASDG